MKKLYFLPFLLASTSSFSTESHKTDSDIVKKIIEALKYSSYTIPNNFNELDEVIDDDLENDFGYVSHGFSSHSPWTDKKWTDPQQFNKIDDVNTLIKHISNLLDDVPENEVPAAALFLETFIPLVQKTLEKTTQLNTTISAFFKKTQDFQHKSQKALDISKELPPKKWNKAPLKDPSSRPNSVKADKVLPKSERVPPKQKKKSSLEKIKTTLNQKAKNKAKRVSPELWIP